MPTSRIPSRRRALAAVLAVAALGASACSSAGAVSGDGSSEDALVVYSGRNEKLVAPLLEQLEEVTGTPVEVRYGTSAELAAQLLEEGENTDADVFFSQDAGALGALSAKGLLAPLDPAVLEQAPEDYRSAEGTWVATSARARVVAYDPGQVAPDQLPTGIDDLVVPGSPTIGYAPTNASFQAFVTGLRVLRGEDGARQWLEAFAATDPVAFDNNIAVLEAVDSGEVGFGLINHYYWYERVAELGEDAVSARIHHLGGGDPGALVNVAGVGVLEGTDQPEAAAETVEFLVGEEAQQYFADETAEYPVRAGVTTTEHDLPALDPAAAPDIDLSDLSSLEQTLQLLDEVGLT